MPTFEAPDGTLLAYRTEGDGHTVVCLAGGPMMDAAYLGDLGGLSQACRTVLLDLRGTGDSAIPADPASYRCDRQVCDVEALREHLGLERIDVLGHSAGANLAARYAAMHPYRIGRLALVTPSTRAMGVDISGDDRLAVAELRRDEPWFTDAYAALERVVAEQGREEDWEAVAPFFHGRWDSAAQDHHAAVAGWSHPQAAEAFGADGAYEPEATRTALADFPGEVLVVAGEVDLNSPPRAVAELATVFPRAAFVVLPGAGHYPWLDDRQRFVGELAAFLSVA